jgi:hypothetical protein
MPQLLLLLLLLMLPYCLRLASQQQQLYSP